jgi:hypothetical protein
LARLDYVKLFFLQLPAPEAAIARLAMRVRQGGHDIPENVIIRRFDAGLRNLERAYKSAVDAWAVYDNSGEKPSLLQWNEITSPDISTAKDPDLRSAMAALMRASALARKAAMDAGTDLVLFKDGILVLVEANMLRRQSQAEAASAP